jgi:hypothetical protein
LGGGKAAVPHRRAWPIVLRMSSPLTFSVCFIEHRPVSLRIYLTGDDFHYAQCLLEIRRCHREGNVEKIVIRTIELN